MARAPLMAAQLSNRAHHTRNRKRRQQPTRHTLRTRVIVCPTGPQ